MIGHRYRSHADGSRKTDHAAWRQPALLEAPALELPRVEREGVRVPGHDLFLEVDETAADDAAPHAGAAHSVDGHPRALGQTIQGL